MEFIFSLIETSKDSLISEFIFGVNICPPILSLNLRVRRENLIIFHKYFINITKFLNTYRDCNLTFFENIFNTLGIMVYVNKALGIIYCIVSIVLRTKIFKKCNIIKYTLIDPICI